MKKKPKEMEAVKVKEQRGKENKRRNDKKTEKKEGQEDEK